MTVGIHKTAETMMQDNTLLDFTMMSKMTDDSVVGSAIRRKTRSHLASFLCIMTVLMTIYTDYFLSSTGVFTTEVVSACADITACAEDDCATCHTF